MGKHEMGSNVTPARNIGEGSGPKGSVTKPLQADSRERPALIHEVLERDAKRDIGAELLQSVREMKAGERGRVHQLEVSPVMETRHKVGLSQAQFAVLLGVSKRTLQDWEQGRREPSGAAKSLLKVAEKRPDVLREIFG
jgi:putative transcriptional regulator